MPLKKPSDFFKKEETSLDSIKGEMDVSSPDKIERVSEAFTAFRSNLNHIQSLTDFSDTFDGFKDNVDKVDKLSEEIVNVKQDIQNLIKKEELDDAMMAHLYFVEESITKIEKKATTINKEAVSNINKEVSDLSIIIPGKSKFPGQTNSNDNNFHIEDCQVSISHMITGLFKNYLKN